MVVSVGTLFDYFCRGIKMKKIIFLFLILIGCSGETINKLDIVDTTTGSDSSVDVSDSINVEDIKLFNEVDTGITDVAVIDTVVPDVNVVDTVVPDVNVVDSGVNWLINSSTLLRENQYGLTGYVRGNSVNGRINNIYYESNGVGKYCVYANAINSNKRWWYSIDIMFTNPNYLVMADYLSFTPKLSGKSVNGDIRISVHNSGNYYSSVESTCEKPLWVGISLNLKSDSLNFSPCNQGTPDCKFIFMKSNYYTCPADSGREYSVLNLTNGTSTYLTFHNSISMMRFVIESNLTSTDAGDSYLCLEDLRFNK